MRKVIKKTVKKAKKTTAKKTVKKSVKKTALKKSASKKPKHARPLIKPAPPMPASEHETKPETPSMKIAHEPLYVRALGKILLGHGTEKHDMDSISESSDHESGRQYILAVPVEPDTIYAHYKVDGMVIIKVQDASGMSVDIEPEQGQEEILISVRSDERYDISVGRADAEGGFLEVAGRVTVKMPPSASSVSESGKPSQAIAYVFRSGDW